MEEMYYFCRMLVNDNLTYFKYNIPGVKSPEKSLLFTSINIGRFQPDSSISDFIENKTKPGGLSLNKSMSWISFCRY
jgi:hypothetical protein